MVQPPSSWKRIYPDLPGHGLTTIAESIENHDQVLDVLLEFMDSIYPNETYAVAGESRGDYLASNVCHQLNTDGYTLGFLDN